MIFKSIKRSTYERNKRAGKYEVLSESANGAHVVPHEIRGIYGNVPNDKRISVSFSFMLSTDEVAAQEKAAHDAMMSKVRAAKQKPAACPECERSFGPHYKGECEHG